MVGQMLGVRFGPRSSQDSRVSRVWREVLGWYGPPCAQSLRSKDPARLFSLPTRFPAAPPPPPHCRHPPTTSSSLWACWGGRCGTRLPPFLEGSCHTLVTSCDLDCPLPSAATLGSGIPINPDEDIQPTVVCALPVFGTERPIGHLLAHQDLTWQVARSSQVLGRVLAPVWGCFSACDACWVQPVFRSWPGRAGGMWSPAMLLALGALAAHLPRLPPGWSCSPTHTP